MANISAKTGRMVRLAVFIAIIFLLEVTNLGFIKTPALELTIMQIPVLVGAITLGPASGALLGGVFGLTSFYQCFGKSEVGATLLGINPFYTFIVCMVPRILMGWLCGLIFRSLYHIDKTKVLSFAVASLSGALLNTVFFMSALMLLFGRTDFIMGLREGRNVLSFIVWLVGIQGLIEALVCFFIGTAISKALYGLMNPTPPQRQQLTEGP